MENGGAGAAGNTTPVSPDAEKSFLTQAPSISLPKGGGAIRGIGEKFTANPVTGTAGLSIPIATSPGRSGFGPQLSLSYDSGSGNGPFGLGWSLSLPSITRKTDKGLPTYQDALESDVFILSGAEDLVPVPRPANATDPAGYRVQRYRPRIEGLFARIERWTAEATGETHWRSISRDNVTTLYGTDNNSRIFDPADPDPDHPSHIFSWLICQQYDDKGNAIEFEYVEEDSRGIDLSQVHERNRTPKTRATNRYLKNVRYGNTQSRLLPAFSNTRWMFEVVFDYGDGNFEPEPPASDGRLAVRARLNPTGAWAPRPDPFSSYRPGFEVRTYRLCQRVLMFHHFPDELGVDDYLVGSTEFSYELGPVASFLSSVIQSGYVAWPDAANPTDRFLRRSLPPLEFEYSKPVLSNDVRTLDRESFENFPGSLDGYRYRWLDLDGEGLSGILTEQAATWYYKRNLGEGRFGPVERVARVPSGIHLNTGGQQFLDISGSGRMALAEFAGATPGLYQRTADEDWESFTPFQSLPRIDWADPNLRFVDLTGNGLADVLITEDSALRWHPSLARDGFGTEQRRLPALDEEKGPRLVFADGTESIYLADLSGDGLSDLVRIRNGEVSYWPNLGYGRFGSRVTMDGSPRFDHPDQFDQLQLRLADIDGSGTTDLIYLRRGQATIYRNLSGNAWADAETLAFPAVDDLSSVLAVDLLGTGTACLVWSSPLPRDTRLPLRFVELMAQGKPHLLRTITNNLGAKTEIEYTPSTAFYLADRNAGRPWITKLPFPVHCVTRVAVTDQWRHATFATTYSYHHGYFDGAEREFRGFGRVEQVDVESYGRFAAANIESPYITSDTTLYQPPVKTITWFHTGAALDRRRILTQFEAEYFPSALAARPADVAIDGLFQEKSLGEPDLDAEDLSAEEWREGMRACKGMTLRQEIYELDVDRLEATGDHVPVRLFSAASHNCNIRRLQARAGNRHAVFLVTESEALTYHYELDLRAAPAPTALEPDPRIAHTLNLSLDELGNVRQSIAIGYPRVRSHQDKALDAAQLTLVRGMQDELHVAYAEAHHTNDVPQNILDGATVDDYRLRVPCEVQTYELTGFAPGQGRYFELEDFREYALSTTLPGQGPLPVVLLPYHDLSRAAAPAKRLVEHIRTLFFKDDLSDFLPAGELGRLGLIHEQYKLALTDELLDDVFTNGQLDQVVDGGDTARECLEDSLVSGYLSGAGATDRFGNEAAGQYWVRSGIAGFASDAADHFYLPERYTDPFGGRTTLEYDGNYDLFVASSTDPHGNTARVTRFDYRTLAPAEMEDINANRTEAYFDALGRVIAVAIKGKGNQGDNLTGYDDALANPELSEVLSYFDAGPLTVTQARDLFAPVLGNATTRYLYHFGEAIGAGGAPDWLDRPAGACAIVREQHVGSLAAGDPPSPLQVAFECSDGMGAVLMKRVQAEPAQAGGPLRWIVSGKTVLNNKGKAVKQYEPYFSDSAACCAEDDPQEEVGVTPLLYYDAAGRLVRTELADGTYSKVEFSPWHVTSFDANDTAYDADPAGRSDWYNRRKDPAHPRFAEFDSPRNAGAADSVELHAGTPSRTILDSLGREVISIVHNRYADTAGVRDERYLTFTRLDAEGKALWVRDAQGKLVMQYITPARAHDASGEDVPAGVTPCYDIAGNLLYQHSMDGGDRWVLMDAAGKSMLAWDSNDRMRDDGSTVTESRVLHIRYDALHRPVEQWLITNDAPALVEAFEYVDTNDFASAAGVVNQPALSAAQARNLIGEVRSHYDPGGLVTVERVDFNGAMEEVTRTLVADVRVAVVDWNLANRATLLESETFIQITEHDALGRETTRYNWHRDTAGQPGYSTRVAVNVSAYNPRGLLATETIHVRAEKQPGAGGRPRFVENPAANRNVVAITRVTWNARGQKLSLELGNGTTTRYTYDDETFRLAHLYTRRPNTFTGDCAGNINAARPARPCGVQNLHYTYDAVGNVTTVEDDAQPTIWFANQQVEPNNQYTYDALYRLIEATGRENATAVGAPPHSEAMWPRAAMPSTDSTRNCTQRYRYDRVGNITLMRHVATQVPGMPDGSWTREYAYAYDDTAQAPSNRLWQTWLGGDRTQAITYRHDPHGNLLNLANTAPGQDVRWEWRDMIRALDLLGGGTAHYNYDIGKQRTRKRLERIGGDTEDRIYLGGYELYRRRNPAGNVIEEIDSIHVFEGGQRVLLVDDVITAPAPAVSRTVFRYQYGNHLGSVTAELDESCRVISYEEFHPYGTSAYRLANSAVEAPTKRYRYAGMERDEESGLTSQGARYSASWLGRWISSDPAGILDGLNSYQYSASNPVTYVDTNGRRVIPAFEFFKGIGEEAVDAAGRAVGGLRRYLDSARQGVGKGLTLGTLATPETMREYMTPTERERYDQLQEDLALVKEKGRFALLEKYDPLAQAVRYGDLSDQEAGKGIDALESGDEAAAAGHFRQSGRHFLHVITKSFETGQTVAGGLGAARGLRVPGTVTNRLDPALEKGVPGGARAAPRPQPGSGGITFAQEMDHTCVPAVTRMAAADRGILLPEAMIAKELGTSLKGTSLTRLADFFRIRGFRTEVFGTFLRRKLDIEGLLARLKSGKTVVVSIDLGASARKARHSVIVESYDPKTKQFWVRDPAEGRTRPIDRTTFADQWRKTSNKAVVIDKERTGN